MTRTRRALMQTSAGIALAAMFPRLASAHVTIEKAGICQVCNGNGNCDSKVCGSDAELGQTGVCWPNENPCAGRSRDYFTCKSGKEQCCTLTRKGATKHCKPV